MIINNIYHIITSYGRSYCYNNKAKIGLFDSYIVTSVKDSYLNIHDLEGNYLHSIKPQQSNVTAVGGG